MNEETFWNWFKVNNLKFYYLSQITDLNEKEKLLDELLHHLQNYSNKLYFEIGGMPNEPQELIISAAGNRDYFDKVKSLVAKAPSIPNWKVIALKPPMSNDFVTEYEGIKLNPQSSWFLPLENKNNPNQLGLKIYIPNYNIKKEKQFVEGCYQMLYTILGEESVALNVAHLEVGKLPKKPAEEGLIELTELAKYINWKKNLS